LNALLDANHLMMGGPVMVPLLSWSLLQPAQPGRLSSNGPRGGLTLFVFSNLRLIWTLFRITADRVEGRIRCGEDYSS
jgi:hypothetical protein